MAPGPSWNNQDQTGQLHVCTFQRPWRPARGGSRTWNAVELYPHKMALMSLWCRLFNFANLTIWMHFHTQIIPFVHLLNVISCSWCKYLLQSLFETQLIIGVDLFFILSVWSFLCIFSFFCLFFFSLPFVFLCSFECMRGRPSISIVILSLLGRCRAISVGLDGMVNGQWSS